MGAVPLQAAKWSRLVGMVVEPEVLAALEGAAAREKGPRKRGSCR
jgi:hypothetical protein